MWVEQAIIQSEYQGDQLEDYQNDLIHIFNKMIFDSLNEQLDTFWS